MKTTLLMHHFSLIAVIALGLLATGCDSSPATVPVKGKVVLPDGSPAPGGMIEFRTTNAEGEIVNAQGKIESDGTFQLSTYGQHDGALPGKHQAILVSPSVEEGPAAKPVVFFPKKYLSYDTSGLEFDIQPGGSDLEIKVEGR